TLFGQNNHRSAREFPCLRLVPGRDFALGEKVHTQFLELPQARKTHSVLGSHLPGSWGYLQGLNEHRLAIGCAPYRTKLRSRCPGLLGTDLVRLALERCRTASQAVAFLADMVERHGQGVFPHGLDPSQGDHGFLIADPNEAFVLETSGNYWASQE